MMNGSANGSEACVTGNPLDNHPVRQAARLIAYADRLANQFHQHWYEAHQKESCPKIMSDEQWREYRAREEREARRIEPLVMSAIREAMQASAGIAERIHPTIQDRFEIERLAMEGLTLLPKWMYSTSLSGPRGELSYEIHLGGVVDKLDIVPVVIQSDATSKPNSPKPSPSSRASDATGVEPSKPHRTSKTVQELELELRDFLAQRHKEGSIASVTIAQVAKFLGCSKAHVSGLLPWKALMVGRRESRQPRVPKAVSFTKDLQDNTDGSGRIGRNLTIRHSEEDDGDGDSGAEDDMDGRQREIERLTAEQEADFEPSPLKKTPYKIRSHKKA